jgi:hypothetical protein
MVPSGFSFSLGRCAMDLICGYDWGVVGENRQRLSHDDFNGYRTLAPVEFHLLRVGTCWDYVEAQRDGFLQLGIEHRIIYMEAGNMERATHTIAIRRDRAGWIWDECAWKIYMGRYSTNSLETVVGQAVRMFRASLAASGCCGDELRIRAIAYNKPLRFGLTVAEFMEYVALTGREVPCS